MTDFQFTPNTGEVVFPNSAGMWPNWELNERNVVVVFGDFGNRCAGVTPSRFYVRWLLSLHTAGTALPGHHNAPNKPCI